MAGTAVQSFVTNDVDESVTIGSRLFFDHQVTPKQAHAEFSYRLSAARVGTVTIGQVRYGCEVSVYLGSVDDSYAVSIPRAGVFNRHVGNREYPSTPELVSVGGPIDDLRVSGFAADDEELAIIRFDRRVLEADLGRLLGTDPPELITFPRPLDLRSGRGAEWFAYARSVLDAVGRSDSLTMNPLIVAQVSSILSTGLLLAADHPFRTALDEPASRPTPATLRRAVQFIEDSAQEPITVPRIADAVGMSVRALTRGFAEHLGTSPLAYLTRVRMDGAHRELVAGDPEHTSVSQIAAAWGFFHFGRFASRYREQYGVSPSQTLRSGPFGR